MEEEAVEDTRVEAVIEWAEGFNIGYLNGFEAGISIGRDQGYEDCLYRIKKMAENALDPDLDAAVKMLIGED